MGYLIGLFLIIYYVVGIFTGKGADSGLLIAAGLFAISGGVSYIGQLVRGFCEAGLGGMIGNMFGSMLKTLGGVAGNAKTDDKE